MHGADQTWRRGGEESNGAAEGGGLRLTDTTNSWPESSANISSTWPSSCTPTGPRPSTSPSSAAAHAEGDHQHRLTTQYWISNSDDRHNTTRK
ncbi:hypothetical protein J4Q44_G00217180 [Coregonus suidteri]|uniref:Uncharacterized protein n=1 Tax=Coregonus suidteri TaxID=861788 RepID=A0AAN8LB03_9TELE